MKSLTYTIALLGASCALATPSPKLPYSQWMTNSMVQRGVGSDYSYDEATFYGGLQSVITDTKNESLKSYYQGLVDAIVSSPDGTITGYNYTHYSLDQYRFGTNLLWWYEQTHDPKYKRAAGRIRAMLEKHPRTPTGGFWHREVVYPNQMWLDGIFMADVFYAKWTSLFDAKNDSAWDDITLQFDHIEAHTRKKNLLLLHGYDESKKAVWADPTTGASPLVWGRAVGWYFMALFEVFPLIPKRHPGHNKLKGYFVKLAEGLKDAQDEKGAWWNIMDDQYKGVAGNYLESSASVMFTYGWLEGLNSGVLPKSQYSGVARKAYKAMVDLFVTKNDDGTINWEKTVEVGSLGSNATFEYYSSIPVRQNDLRGAGVFIQASLEWEKRR